MIIKENSKFTPVYSSENRRINAENSVCERNKTKELINEYFNNYPHAVYENIYLNKEDEKLFSAAQNLTHALDPINHHFVGMRHHFIADAYFHGSSSMKDPVECLQKYFKIRQVNKDAIFYKDSEFIFGSTTRLDFSNQDSVLIIGGGPSSDKLDLSKFYDMPVWTMNNFYKHKDADKFNNIQLMPLLDDVNLKNEELLKFIRNKKPHLVQEITDYGTKRQEEIFNISDDKWAISHTRYRSKLGVGARLISLACNLQIKNIYFCGIDGYDPDDKITHSFEKEKEIPLWLRNSSKNVQDEQFLIFFEYIINLCSLFGCNINDLSKKENSIQYKFLYEE